MAGLLSAKGLLAPTVAPVAAAEPSEVDRALARFITADRAVIDWKRGAGYDTDQVRIFQEWHAAIDAFKAAVRKTSNLAANNAKDAAPPAATIAPTRSPA